MSAPGVGLGQLVLALDSTLVTLLISPRGLDLPVRSAALVDSDDLQFGFSASPAPSDVYFLLGTGHAAATEWIVRQSTSNATARQGLPAAVFVKKPSDTLVAAADAAGLAVVAVQPQARWDRLYRLVTHVFEHRGNRDAPFMDTGTDLFALAQSVAERTHGMVSIEDAQSHVLAYSAANNEADELRRLSILGRSGPPEYLQWLSQWGIFDALRRGTEVVHIAERPEFGLRQRLAIGIHRRDASPRSPAGSSITEPSFIGTIWLQQGSNSFAADAAEVLRGAAVLAARIMNRLAAQPSAHLYKTQQLFGLVPPDDDVHHGGYAAVVPEIDVAINDPLVVIGFHTPERGARIADALALSASAFQSDAQIVANGARTYVMFRESLVKDARRGVVSWVHGTVAMLRNELGVEVRAIIAASLAGLLAVAPARIEIDQALDSAIRHPASINPVTTLAQARTTVLLDGIVAVLRSNDRLIDPRVRELRDHDPDLCETLQSYLDCFGDVAKAAAELQVHPNTVRYRVRRLEKLLATSLHDPDVRLVLTLSLRATV